MNTHTTMNLPWEIITLLGVDQITPENLHLYNAILYGVAERFNQHGLEWIRENAAEIRTEICAAARYAGADICSLVQNSADWQTACAEAERRLAAARADVPPAPEACRVLLEPADEESESRS